MAQAGVLWTGAGEGVMGLQHVRKCWMMTEREGNGLGVEQHGANRNYVAVPALLWQYVR